MSAAEFLHIHPLATLRAAAPPAPTASDFGPGFNDKQMR